MLCARNRPSPHGDCEKDAPQELGKQGNRGRSRLRIARQYEYGPGLECKMSCLIRTKRLWILDREVSDWWIVSWIRKKHQEMLLQALLDDKFLNVLVEQFMWKILNKWAGLWASHHLGSELMQANPGCKGPPGTDSCQRWTEQWTCFAVPGAMSRAHEKRLMEIWHKLQKPFQKFSGEGFTVSFAGTAFAAHFVGTPSYINNRPCLLQTHLPCIPGDLETVPGKWRIKSFM